MSYVKNIVSQSVSTLFPDATFELTRKWKGHVTINKLASLSLPFFMLDNISDGSEATIFQNFNYIYMHRFLLTCLLKVDNHATEEQKETAINEAQTNLSRIAGHVYKNIRVMRDNVRFRITPLPEIYSGIYAGATLDMTIPETKSIEACE